jgi:hypothetical protein
MGLINWIFDFYQHGKINRAERDAEELRHELRALRSDAARADSGIDQERLLRAIGELALAVKTMQRLCIEKGVCSESEFHRRLREVDLEDGSSDGMSPHRGR